MDPDFTALGPRSSCTWPKQTFTFPRWMWSSIPNFSPWVQTARQPIPVLQTHTCTHSMTSFNFSIVVHLIIFQVLCCSTPISFLFTLTCLFPFCSGSSTRPKLFRGPTEGGFGWKRRASGRKSVRGIGWATFIIILTRAYRIWGHSLKRSRLLFSLGRHSSEVAFGLFAQLPRVRFSAYPRFVLMLPRFWWHY